MKKLTRRELIKRTAAAAAALAAPAIVPSTALGKDGAVAPSERIVMGAIGIGNRGASDLNWMLGEKDMHFVAICDIRKSRREYVKSLVDSRYGSKDCAMFIDLREFLAARDDIDALLIATGDRWHALASVLAMKAGKDMYCEKPGTMTIAEGQALRDTERRYGRVFQTGTQRRSEGKFVAATQLARLGYLGKLHTVRAHLASWTPVPKFDWRPAEPLPPKDEIDWDLWLGPCPWRPYNSAYVRGGWRGYYDFHSGDIGEWGSHTINQCQMALDSDDTSGIEYEYPGNKEGEGMVIRYANGVKMILQRKGWHGSCGVTFEGTEGSVSVADGYEKPEVTPASLLQECPKLVRDYQAQTQRPLNHVRDFFNCVKTRRRTVSNAEVAHRSMTTCHAANICLWLERNLKWDPVKEEFINDPEANRFLSRAMRQPWQI
ncbi:MAG: Gfo/Idh/MocA family oxidoreductase [Planctomycetes bacterium]|nr:Gfo/Idh/MocA family oxidoreductase [Planctomycetota bacterium]